ncbi:hypothetical protein, partial [Marinimicrobium locisalis]|uniref:hypothetical protein n=1 Tax=Marinimicrobium locisalis TaxID=546022 RepID=UPI0032221275
GTVGIRDDGDIQIDVGSVAGPISVNTTGGTAENGGSITFRPMNPGDTNFTLHLGELIASGGAGDWNNDGGHGGDIEAQAPTIVLHDSLTSLGGGATRNWHDDGESGTVMLTGAVELAEPVTVDLSPTEDLQANPPEGAGNFTLIGTLDSTAGGAQDFTVSATDIFLSQAIGATQALGTVVFNTYGKVTLGGDALPTTAGMTINGQTDSNELQAPNTSSLWTLTNSGAGSVAPDSEGTGGTVSFTGIETLRAGNSTNRFEVDLATGAPDNIAFSLFGGTGEDTLVGGDVTNTWDLGAEETLNDNLSFEGIETLIGGGQTDTFEVSDGTT